MSYHVFSNILTMCNNENILKMREAPLEKSV